MTRKLVFVMMSLSMCAAGSFTPPANAQTNPPVVTVNGTTILQSEVIKQLWNLHGTVVVDAMIDRVLMQQESKRLKVTANKKEIESRLSGIRQQFPDKKAFEEQLEKTGTTLATIREQIRLQLLTEATVVKAKKITITKKELKAFFEVNKDKLASPESVRISHILVKNKQEASDLIIALNAGADFGKLAQQKSLDTATREKGGDMGFITKGILTPDVEKVIFKLKKGEHSGIVSTNVGFHILQVDDRKKSIPANFKKIKKDLRKAQMNTKISKALPELLKELKAKARIEYHQPAE